MNSGELKDLLAAAGLADDVADLKEALAEQGKRLKVIADAARRVTPEKGFYLVPVKWERSRAAITLGLLFVVTSYLTARYYAIEAFMDAGPRATQVQLQAIKRDSEIRDLLLGRCVVARFSERLQGIESGASPLPPPNPTIRMITEGCVRNIAVQNRELELRR